MHPNLKKRHAAGAALGFSRRLLINPKKKPKKSHTKAAGRFFSERVLITDLADNPDFWKLVIDGRFHQFGKTFFDINRPGAPGEPGYIECAAKAFRIEFLPNLSKPLTVDMIVSLHDALIDGLAGHEKGLRSCMKGIKGEAIPVKAFPVFMPRLPSLRNRADTTLTVDGAREICAVWLNETESNYNPYQLYASLRSSVTGANEIYIVTDDNFSQLHGFETFERFMIIALPTQITLHECLDFHIANYHQAIQEAGDNYMQKLQAICKFLSTLERVHPFNDGNCRTVYFLLQKLLIDNNFPPSVLENPNIFDGFSVNELVEKVVLGMDRFASCFPNVIFSSSVISRDALKAMLKERVQESMTNCNP
jgi:hypothetical protein